MSGGRKGWVLCVHSLKPSKHSLACKKLIGAPRYVYIHLVHTCRCIHCHVNNVTLYLAGHIVSMVQQNILNLFRLPACWENQ